VGVFSDDVRRRDTAPVEEQYLAAVHLDVYDTRDGPWNPEHGVIEIPEDWEFLAAGEALRHPPGEGCRCVLDLLGASQP
jgi:hypothetical protein